MAIEAGGKPGFPCRPKTLDYVNRVQTAYKVYEAARMQNTPSD